MRCASRPWTLILSLALLVHSSGLVWAGDGDGDDHGAPGAMGVAPTLLVSTGANATTASPDGKWDVNAPPGEHHDARIDVTTGTWMSVDASPDGRSIVFDLLGDLYLIPMTGGEAKSLTHGMAWDEQPRWSPDGQHIAFTSDRAGGDNIWVMDRDGAHARAVTKETYRLLNSPAWSPDGQYIAARKHFTSTRSAGAGEVWLYHASGSDGLQMTKRRTDQKDEGEPAFSPDGRYLYWGMDATAGRNFEYNKDANTQIYCIQRLDRESGEIRTFAGGPGGAIRPTPPDGRSVAFIRRVRGQSVLYLADVASGAERPLYGHLDRDNQEVWAVHGVYPGIAWTPDSRSLVFWAKGGIHRLDVATRQVVDIPFHVADTRRVNEAVRFPVAVAPDSLPARMLRWVTVSPQGDRVVYSALGRLYVKALPNGAPKRLTTQTDHFEFHPAWSRDGKSIVYVGWDDAKLGTVRVAPAIGGAGRVVTKQPGHYVGPCFSPDGRTIVYRAVGGGYLFSPLWARETGIFRVSAAGGGSTLITQKGEAPQFGASNDRVFLIDIAGADGDERSLFSVDMAGASEHAHLIGAYFTEARLSPDERWIAFREKYRVWVAPFTRTGNAIDMGPTARGVPVKLVSRDAGDFLDWSGDSRTLHWSLGHELFTRHLKDLFTFAPRGGRQPGRRARHPAGRWLHLRARPPSWDHRADRRAHRDDARGRDHRGRHAGRHPRPHHGDRATRQHDGARRGTGVRCRGQHHRAGIRGRALAWRHGRGAIGPAELVDQRRLARVRRDHAARPVERLGPDLHGRRVAAGGHDHGSPHLLDGHHPVRSQR